jgi:hypothetical protein
MDTLDAYMPDEKNSDVPSTKDLYGRAPESARDCVASADPASEYDAVVAVARNREVREGIYPGAPEGLAQTSGRRI